MRRWGRWGGCFGAQSTSPSPTRKAVLGWLVWAGYRKKSRFLRYCKQACISSFRLFFCAFHARDHALRDRPAVIIGWLRLRGDAVFPAGKTSGFSRCGETAKATHKPTQRQSGRQRRPGLQSKLKKGLEAEGELARKSDSKPFFIQTAATQTAANHHARPVSLFLSLTQRKKRPLRPLPVVTPPTRRNTSSAADNRDRAASQSPCPAGARS